MTLHLPGVFFKRLYLRPRYFKLCRHGTCRNSHALSDLILSKTELTGEHLTPEIYLHLISPRCKLWYSKGNDLPFQDPFWAFYWPGGQVLSRYILDNKNLFSNKNVIDIGSGCGASAIACKLAGAHSVVANDVDHVALEAVRLNGLANQTELQLSSENLIGSVDNSWDIVLLGDMFYDMQFVNIISDWLPKLWENMVTVYIGDPGRLPLEEHPLKSELKLVFKYKLPEQCLKENNGMDTGYVWKYAGSKH